MIQHPVDHKIEKIRKIWRSLIVIGAAAIILVTAVFVFAQSGTQASRINNFTQLVPGQWTDPVKMEVYQRNIYLIIKQKFLSDELFASNPRVTDNLNVRIKQGKIDKPVSNNELPVVYEGKLSSMNAKVPGRGIKALFGLDKVQVFYVEFQLDSGAGNELQGEEAGFSVRNI